MKIESILLIFFLIKFSGENQNNLKSNEALEGKTDTEVISVKQSYTHQKPKQHIDCPSTIPNITFTPPVILNASIDFSFICDLHSFLQQIILKRTLFNLPIACNDIATTTEDDFYNGFLNTHFGNPHNTVPLVLTNSSTQVFLHNGALSVVQCATVAVEKCKGDQLNLFLIMRPDSDYACSMNGIRKLIGLYGIVNVNGKCQSSCHMQYAYIYNIDPPVSNNGAVGMGEDAGGSAGK